jgi:protein MpaA
MPHVWGGRGRALLLGLAVLLVPACAEVPAAGARHPPAASVRPAPAKGSGPVRVVFGTSVQGRPLVAYRWGAAESRRRVLVVGLVHGNEAAGLAICNDLLRYVPAPGAQVIVVPDLNPDGLAARTRQNAHGVDLNRNFAYRWRPLGRRGDQQYSGSGPLSEPESRALASLVRRLRPTVSVWFHQPVGVVDASGGSVAVERRFAEKLGEPLRQLVRYPGSAPGWQNSAFPGTTAFVVEMPHTARMSAALRGQAVAALRDLER